MTQCEEILKYLKTGKSITQRHASRYMDCDRLSARILDLRRRGWNIATIEKIKRKRRTGRICRFAAYKLIEPRISPAPGRFITVKSQ